MKCVFCEQYIENYSEEFNRFVIDKSKSVAICLNCIHKLVKWQQEVFIKLFPTKVAKKWFGKKNEAINL